MKLLQVIFRSVNDGLSTRSQQLYMIRNLSTNVTSGNGVSNLQSSRESEENHIFCDTSSPDHCIQSLEKLKKNRDSDFNGGNRAYAMDGLDGSSNDGMDTRLAEKATYFDFDLNEIAEDHDYAFRPDVKLLPPGSYTPKDLDLTKPGMRRPFKRMGFEVTTKDVLQKADFRNVRFLANFITEGGIIIKRSQTKISAKAQRKVAREIKTARAFGLLPFTTMGTKSFQYGRSMEACDDDFEYETYDNAT